MRVILMMRYDELINAQEHLGLFLSDSGLL